ncbi:hypothetical protein BDB00DRAFT_140099 [Zychaea mexicana]|uniref:uncharacterized protein n=1 Tax=Zychaea mexicana TaxID=64656 RepID=UPI0022FEFD8C|nr:uncharacterized protein BDB00DRAFT_140099 [Zychaea mexicana]KAI9496270.1 hypothetical protein BDB00DRAFT_140099 [Zychaea mexicana]
MHNKSLKGRIQARYLRVCLMKYLPAFSLSYHCVTPYGAVVFCKTWRTFLLSSSIMWRNITGCNITCDLALYEINGKYVREVDMPGQDHDAANLLVHWGCSKIYTMVDCRILIFRILFFSVPLATIGTPMNFSITCPYLTRLRIPGCIALKRLAN